MDSYLTPVQIMAVSGVTNLSADDWMQTDFLTLEAIFLSCAIVEQWWLSSFTEEETLAACGGSIFIGGPTVQQVQLPPPLSRHLLLRAS
jgi:hypothetical protein